MQQAATSIATSPLIRKVVANPEILKAHQCRRDFFVFVQEFWEEIIQEPPVWNWHISYLCGELSKVAYRVMAGLPKEYDLIINIPPGTTKSTIATVMFPIWCWIARLPVEDEYKAAHSRYYNMNKERAEAEQFPFLTGRHLRFIAGSHADRLATDHSVESRDIIRSEKFQRYFPEIVIRKDLDSKTHFKNESGGERISTSVGGSITGQHAHIQIVDDPIDPKGSNSEAERLSANHWMDQTLSTRKVSKERTPLILIMQRLHQEDPTGHKLEKAKDGAKIKHICLPGELTEDIKPVGLKRFYKDGLLDPVRLSRNVLQDMEIDLGQYGYAGQALQSPTPPAGGMFKPDLMEVVNALPSKIKKIVRYWDKAGTDAIRNAKAAYSMGVKMAALENGQFAVIDIVGGQWRAEVRERNIRQTAQLDGQKVPIGIEQEPGSGGLESAENTIRNLAGFVVKKDKVSKSKELRADTFSVQVNNGNVLLMRADWNRKFIEELRFFPVGALKDQVDAASGAFNNLVQVKKVGVW